MPASSSETLTNKELKSERAFRRYSIIAYLTGTLLILLTIVFIGKLVTGQSESGFWKDATSILGILHGWGFMIYFLITLDLSIKASWKPLKALGIILCGTIPAMSFVMEHHLRKTEFSN